MSYTDYLSKDKNVQRASLVVLVVVFVLLMFLLFREFNCWFLKNNQMIRLLRDNQTALNAIKVAMGVK